MSVAAGGQLGQSAEDYLKAMYRLQEAGGPVSTSSLASALDVSPAAATKAVQLLADKKLIRYRPYHGAKLTDSGRRAALTVVRRHRLLELFLHDVLGYGWDEVDAEAERLEHHVSDEFIARLDRLLDYPRLDPHGDPIPSDDGTLAACSARTLADCELAERVTVERVSDKDSQVLQYLARYGLRPGAEVIVVEKEPFNGPLTLCIDGADRAIGREVAGYVFVCDQRTDVSSSEDAPESD